MLLATFGSLNLKTVQEVFVAGSLALILFLLVAKLISMATATKAGLRDSQLKSSGDHGKEIIMKETIRERIESFGFPK